jgi:hypothetical protein
MRSIKIIFIILNILIYNNIYSQKYVTNIKRNLIEYQISDSLKNLLIKYIINDFEKYNDNSIYFLVDANFHKYVASYITTDTCIINIELITEMLPSIDKKVKGFFKLNNKLFLVINGNKDFLYPSDNIKEIEYTTIKINNSDPLEELYYLDGDAMPFWLFGCKDGELYLIDYWKNYNFNNW